MKALYRKYRPKSLKEVIGQEKVTDILENSIKNKTFSHAYLFTGPRGTGKTSVARIFAHEINDFSYEIEDNYVDIIEIDAASNTGVDNIRDLKERASVAPTKGQYKVYIIDEVHMLSKSAFNALLKILEEPPKHVIFLLATTDIQKVPITITSRVQKLVFSLASKDIMTAYLKNICEKEKINIEEEALSIIVNRGGGSFRDSLSLLDQISNLSKDKITKELVEKSLGLPQDELIKNLLISYNEGNLEEISKNLKTILNTGVKPETLAEEIINIILDNPKPELLDLLSKLPDVKSPFPEAKLLLAFTTVYDNKPNFGPKTVNFQPKIAPLVNQILPKTQNTPTENFQKPQIAGKKDMQENSLKKANDNSNSSPKPAETTPNFKPNTTNFTWENFTNNIKSKLLKPQIEKCHYIIENNSLKLYPTTNGALKILSSPNNIKSIKKYLPDNYDFYVLDIKEYPKNDPAKNEKLNKINDIMGETQEVENDGEIPF